MEISELDKTLAQAKALAEKYKLPLQESLLLIIAHELICIHYHMDLAAKAEA